MGRRRPHERYFTLTEREKREVRAYLGAKARTGDPPDDDAIEAAIDVVLARRAWNRRPPPMGEDPPAR